MNETRWWKYVQVVAGDVQAKEIADVVGIDKSNVTRWKQGSRPAVEFVLKFARAYGRSVIEALAESEYITDDEANIREVKIGAEDLSEVDLARELLGRVERRASSNVTVGRFGVRGSAQDERAVAKKKGRDRGEDTDA
ncbi:helix-turn-helix domain-containing protein [Microbacterium oleivorans]|uniref:Helix-turn-helix transcriptional regulator n=1 Tax=Microbacterium oleivorans TaxID=273677 RepID=A0A7D5EVP9_9MICO|nr:helix-turn-helix transcriptional regulator [Microbacterium oleivorans]QLD10926.1 helix-turn-helix transcriptional regulator [Microbacterium oleivorans]